MRSLVAIAAISFATVLVGACDTGGSTDTGTQGQDGGSCRALCANVAAAECPAAGEADCLVDCEATAAIAAASESEACEAVWAGYVECMADAALECNGSDVSRLPCRADYDRTQNYCVHGFTPEEPCLDNPVASDLCGGATPHAKLCRGDAEKGCVLGGTANHTDFYCCPEA